MGPVAAPLEDVAVHVVQSPRVGWVTSDFCGPTERRPRLGSVIRLAFKVRLLAAELVAKRGGGRRPGSAGVFPLRFRGQPELPIHREDTGLSAQFGQFMAERFRFGKVDIANRKVIAL